MLEQIVSGLRQQFGTDAGVKFLRGKKVRNPGMRQTADDGCRRQHQNPVHQFWREFGN